MAVVEERNPLQVASHVVELDELAARRSLRGQIAKLEAELAAAVVDAWPGRPLDVERVAGRGGPRLLSLGELETIRDALADRVRAAQRTLALRQAQQAETRLLLERMYASPRSYKWVRVSREDLGEHGCGHYHVRPRLGPVGLLLSWWQVKISSGCPLAT